MIVKYFLLPQAFLHHVRSAVTTARTMVLYLYLALVHERRQYVYPRQGAGSPPRVKELTERKDIRVISRQQAVRCRDGVAYIVIRELSFLYDNTPRAALLSPLLF